jgi:nucleotide-binding universal stress UspA family protein
MEREMLTSPLVSLIDTTAAEQPALALARSVARWQGAALHVVGVSPARAGARGRRASSRNDVEARLREIVAALGSDGVTVVPAALEGDAAAAVAGYVDDIGAGLLVIGSRGGRGRGSSSAASFAAALGTALHIPVLAVPHRQPTTPDTAAPFHHVLAAVDFSAASLRALDRALDVARCGSGRLTVLHVLEHFPGENVYSGARAARLVQRFEARVDRVTRALLDRIAANASRYAVEVRTVSGDADDAILATAATRGVDLIVMGAEPRPRLERLLVGSTARRVLRRASAPVLLVPPPPAAEVMEVAS